MSKQISKLQSFIDKYLTGKKRIKALEAGCGSFSHIDMGKSAYIVGIDISKKRLKENKVLNEKILGDIQSYDLPISEFDVIFCWDVLEHLEQPKKALKNLIKALKRDGIIVLALPNLISLKGMLTKYTPHWFHVWIYKNIMGYEMAGKEDHVPFRTFYRYLIAPRYIKQYAYENNLSIEYFSIYECRKQKRIRKNKFYNIIFNILILLIKVLSFNKIDAGLTDYIIVLKKSG
jgi:SAM-dependent methyltransferase